MDAPPVPPKPAASKIAAIFGRSPIPERKTTSGSQLYSPTWTRNSSKENQINQVTIERTGAPPVPPRTGRFEKNTFGRPQPPCYSPKESVKTEVPPIPPKPTHYKLDFRSSQPPRVPPRK